MYTHFTKNAVILKTIFFPMTPSSSDVKVGLHPEFRFGESNLIPNVEFNLIDSVSVNSITNC